MGVAGGVRAVIEGPAWQGPGIPLRLGRRGRFPELARRHVRVLLEGGVEGGLGIEPGVHGDRQDAGLTALAESLFRGFDAILIDEVEEIAAGLLVDDLGQVVRRNPHMLGQLGQRQGAVQVWPGIRHVPLQLGQQRAAHVGIERGFLILLPFGLRRNRVGDIA